MVVIVIFKFYLIFLATLKSLESERVFFYGFSGQHNNGKIFIAKNCVHLRFLLSELVCKLSLRYNIIIFLNLSEFATKNMTAYLCTYICYN